ncbi:hypothetical protein WJX74_010198 [Apatococcus lobatus]|uniref:Fungal lipase-type domain-containing protein n=1 Tax=Apatococcus lobatus TaxID=904363 RepID=A0AAW1Q5S6_9CHLO
MLISNLPTKFANHVPAPSGTEPLGVCCILHNFFSAAVVCKQPFKLFHGFHLVGAAALSDPCHPEYLCLGIHDVPFAAWPGYPYAPGTVARVCLDAEPILSGLVYDSHEAEVMEAKMGWGYELLGLDQHELIWEHHLDTKVLLGWGPGGVAVAFRGTASLRNALSDLQVWRSDHPPVRGSRMMWQRPVVHSGFLRCWLEDGLSQRVVQRVLALAAAWEADHPGQHVPVLVTGHRQGGALSDLAAYDIAQAAAAAGAKLRLACYTYGAPRVGNHAYAKDHAGCGGAEGQDVDHLSADLSLDYPPRLLKEPEV